MEMEEGKEGTEESNANPSYNQLHNSWDDWVSWIWEHSHCAGLRASPLGAFIRGIELSKMAGQLPWVSFIALTILLIVFPTQQLDAQILLLGMDWDYWSLHALVNVYYFEFYVIERLLLLYAGAVRGIQTAMQFNILGMEAITENTKVQMDYYTKGFLLIAGTCVGVFMTLYPTISFVSWLPLNIIIGGAQQLNITASASHFSMTMHTSLNGALPLPKLTWLILGIISQCLNYILQFIWAGSSFLLHAHVIQKTVSQTIERRDGFGKLLNSYEKYFKHGRIWIKIYYWVLWGYDRLLDSFPDCQDDLDIPIVWVGLAVLSILLTYCYIEFDKLVNIVATCTLQLSNGWNTFYGFVTLNVP